MCRSQENRSGKYTTQMDTPKGLRVARKSIRRRILQRRRKRIAMLFAKKHERTPVHEGNNVEVVEGMCYSLHLNALNMVGP